MPRSTRPFERMSRVAAVIAVIAGVRAGIWKIPDPSLIRLVCDASQARIVAVSEPYASAAQTESQPVSSAARTSSSWFSEVSPSPQ
jgi:hypothetical protein